MTSNCDAIEEEELSVKVRRGRGSKIHLAQVVATQDANQVVVFKEGTAVLNCLENVRVVSFRVRTQRGIRMVWFEVKSALYMPRQSLVEERLKLTLTGFCQVAPHRDRVGNHRRHVGGDDEFP